MFFRRRESDRQQAREQLRAGEVYRRVHGRGLVENAEVLFVGEDKSGIAHVVFSLSMERPFASSERGPERRVLAMDTFLTRYPDHVDAVSGELHRATG